MPRLSVAGGNHDRFFVPVSAEVPRPAAGPARLVDLETQRAVPCQWDPEGKRVTFIVANLAAGQTREYEVLAGEPYSLGGGASLNPVGEEKVEVLIGGKVITAYHIGKEYARPFLYPIIGPFGASLTRHFPMRTIEGEAHDHPHHRSVYTAYGDVNGVDDWSEETGHGRILHTGFRGLEQGPVYAAIRANADWVSNAGKKVLSETRDILFYDVPSAGRVVDYTVCLIASEGEVKFGDTKEGGILSVRVATSMDAARGGKIENSYGGVNERETWGKRAEWCDYSGPVEGKWVGIAVMDHPGNLRYPTYWHVRDYGLMTANMFGLSHFYDDPNHRGDYTLPAGESLTFRYRLYLHAGDAGAANVGEKYHDFINPPQVKVVG